MLVPASLTTERLQLLPATPELVRTEMDDRGRFAKLLEAVLPGEWPPELYDRAAMQYTLDWMLKTPEGWDWGLRYVLLDGDVPNQRTLIGTVGIKGPPDEQGSIEVGYGLLRQFQGHGYATEATLGVIDWAFGHSQVSVVRAQTLPHLQASIGVLDRCGFRPAGAGDDEQEAIAFELTREMYEGD